VDAFTDVPFSGNPAGVCLLRDEGDKLLRDEGDKAWMQHVAGEVNLSETAFLLPKEDRVILGGTAVMVFSGTLWV
jgi:PhzF family phenazine biosynthesis protein